MEHSADLGDPERDVEDESFWIAAFSFQRPSMLADDDMAWYFRGYDGRWSDQTKRAVARHGAAGLDLNENWALTSQIWSCAGCGRAKDECFRLSKRNILLAKLELHHDHMRDNLWPMADEVLGIEWRDSTTGATRVLDIVRDLVSRFSEALICSECNAADAKAKKAISGIHPRFTFIAPEIGEFVSAAAGREHVVDFEKAAEIWRRQENGFRTRLDLLSRLIDEIGSGRLSNSNDGWPGRVPLWQRLSSNEVVADAVHRQMGRDDERYLWLASVREEFLARSVSFDSRRLAPSPSAGKTPLGPSDEEYRSYVDPVSTNEWNSASEQWTCSCCGRGKRDIVRKSGKGKWSGGIRNKRVFVEETNQLNIRNRRRLFPSFRNELWIGETFFVKVCSDCREVSRDARQRDPSVPDADLSLEDIRECLIRITPNAKHEVDHGAVLRKLRSNQRLDSAFQAHSEFKSLVANFRSTLEFHMSQGVPREATAIQLRERLRWERNIETEEEQILLLEWLLSLQCNLGADE